MTKCSDSHQLIYDMRQNGASLQQIGDRIGVTRERIRQILTKEHGSTKITNFLSTLELARSVSCSIEYIYRLSKASVIQPAANNHRPLWGVDSIKKIFAIKTCPICGKPTSYHREKFCSQKCLEVSQYKSHCRVTWRSLYRSKNQKLPPSLALIKRSGPREELLD